MNESVFIALFARVKKWKTRTRGMMISSDEAQERRRKYIADSLPSSLYLPLSDTGVVNCVSGATSGAIAAVIVCPLDVLKTRLQVSTLERLDVYEHDGEFEENRTKRRGERVVSRTRTDGGGVVTELGGVFYHVRVFEARLSRAEEEERGFKK